MKYYIVKKDNFMWKAGAILKLINEGSNGGYKTIEDVWDAVPCIDAEYISARIIEHPDNAEFFERVYPDTISGKFYRTKEQLVALYKKTFE